MRELALFAGAGGGLLGSHLLGWRPICGVEISDFCRDLLLARQRDGFLPRFPIWDDVRTFDGRPWRGLVDIVTGGFPCQDISSAGKRAGLDGERSGLWWEYARIVEECEPAWVFIENSPDLRTKGLDRVLGRLAELGFDAEWGVFAASDVGAPHRRKRMWILARHSDDQRHRDIAQHAEAPGHRPASAIDGAAPGGVVADAHGNLVRLQPGRGEPDGQGPDVAGEPLWWPVASIEGVDDGLADRMERTKATGNGQVPRVAALAFSELRRRFG